MNIELRMHHYNLDQLVSFTFGACAGLFQLIFANNLLPITANELPWFIKAALFVLTTFAGGFIGTLGKDMYQRIVRRFNSKGKIE